MKKVVYLNPVFEAEDLKEYEGFTLQSVEDVDTDDAEHQIFLKFVKDDRYGEASVLPELTHASCVMGAQVDSELPCHDMAEQIHKMLEAAGEDARRCVYHFLKALERE